MPATLLCPPGPNPQFKDLPTALYYELSHTFVHCDCWTAKSIRHNLSP